MNSRALIVEDSATQAARLRGLLQRNGWSVRVARNGLEALEICRADTPDIVVSDILMPELDGLELCRRLAKLQPELPVVLLTSLSAPKDVVRALAAGAANYVTKPYEDDELLKRLSRTVGHSRGERDFEALGERLELSFKPVQLLDVLVSSLEDARRRVAELEAAHETLKRAEAENRRLLEEVVAASRAKDQFLAVVSHELRTPLNAIGGWARILQHGALDHAGRERAFAVIARNVEAQARLIEDVLDVSRITSGKIKLDPQVLEIGALLTSTISSFEPAASAAAIRFEVVSTLTDEKVSGDAGRLAQVFTNLIGNAIKFTPKGGTIRVTAERQGDRVEIRVTDDGVGIEPDFLPYVFLQFRQADSSRARRHGGLGLGLAIAKHLVELHAGEILVESGGKGHGSTFRVVLPLLLDSVVEQSPTPASEEFEIPKLSELRMLVVEDNPDSRELMILMLADTGAEIVSAASVEEAQEAMERGPFDLLVSDIGLPREDGLQLVQRIRADARYAGVATVALTAFAGHQAEQEALGAGFDAYVAKPANANRLLRAISEALKRRLIITQGGSRRKASQ